MWQSRDYISHLYINKGTFKDWSLFKTLERETLFVRFLLQLLSSHPSLFSYDFDFLSLQLSNGSWQEDDAKREIHNKEGSYQRRIRLSTILFMTIYWEVFCWILKSLSHFDKPWRFSLGPCFKANIPQSFTQIYPIVLGGEFYIISLNWTSLTRTIGGFGKFHSRPISHVYRNRWVDRA